MTADDYLVSKTDSELRQIADAAHTRRCKLRAERDEMQGEIDRLEAQEYAVLDEIASRIHQAAVEAGN